MSNVPQRRIPTSQQTQVSWALAKNVKGWERKVICLVTANRDDTSVDPCRHSWDVPSSQAVKSGYPASPARHRLAFKYSLGFLEARDYALALWPLSLTSLFFFFFSMTCDDTVVLLQSSRDALSQCTAGKLIFKEINCWPWHLLTCTHTVHLTWAAGDLTLPQLGSSPAL